MPARARLAPRLGVLLACFGAGAVRRGLAEAPADSEAARRYSPAMARCLAALAKLSYCNPHQAVAGQALQETSGIVCEWAGMELEAGSRILGKSSDGASSLDYGFVAKFKRKEEANADSLPDRGCMVVFRGTHGEESDAAFGLGPLSSPQPHAAVGGAASGIVPLRSTLSLSPADPDARQRLEVWESDAVCKGCQVSATLKNEWTGVRARVMDHLWDSDCKPGDALFVTGHSKGAALATLAMFSLQAQEGYHVQPSYNFESPRVGNEAFATAFNRIFNLPVALFRVTHGSDRVPREPRRKLGYIHAGYQVWYRGDARDNNFVVCGNATEDPFCGNEGLPRSHTCPLKADACPPNSTCAGECKKFAPKGGPHCQNPVAPAKSFCDFTGNSTENWGSEWNEVVKRGDEVISWEQTCVWGKALPASAKSAADQEVVKKAEASAAKKAARPPKVAARHAQPTTSRRPELVGTVGPQPVKSKAKAQASKTAREDRNHSCFKTDMTYQPLDMPGHYFTTESDAWACQARCAVIDGCTHFSFFRTGADGDCHVADAQAYSQRGSIGFVSGPRDCKNEDMKGEEYVQFLGSGLTPSKVPSGTSWFAPGLAAAGALSAYFVCLAALALTTMRRTEARMAPPPAEEDGTAPMLDARQRTMSVDGRLRPPQALSGL